MEVLNLYACLGGNRLLWDNCNVTAIELDIELCNLYQKRFPNDLVINTDAHKYLLNNYQKFDFIWSSPPCPSHSKARFARQKNTESIYPDFKLYEEIIFLKHYFKKPYCVENVIPYYKPLIPGHIRDRHIYWTNYNLPNKLSNRNYPAIGGKNEILELSKFHNYNFNNYNGLQRIDKIARNLVDYEAGKTIYDCAINKYNYKLLNQLNLF
jgi:DNA (cytosine-5)-methyltransferase 1